VQPRTSVRGHVNQSRWGKATVSTGTEPDTILDIMPLLYMMYDVCVQAFFLESGDTSDITTQKIGQDSVVSGLGRNTVLHIICKILYFK
jgi:hypothetical protein